MTVRVVDKIYVARAGAYHPKWSIRMFRNVTVTEHPGGFDFCLKGESGVLGLNHDECFFTEEGARESLRLAAKSERAAVVERLASLPEDIEAIQVVERAYGTHRLDYPED